MFQRILVPVDGSLYAERAVAVAARIGRGSAGPVVLLRVVELAPARRPRAPGSGESGPALPPTSGWTPDAIESHRQQAEQYLAGAIERYRLAERATASVVVAASAATAILEAVQAQQADLIVLSRYGHTGPTRWPTGHIADKVMRHATTPVLLLREQDRASRLASPGFGGPLRALVPLDGSELAERALAPAAALVTGLAAPGPAMLHLVRVLQTSDLLLAPSLSGRSAPATGESRDWALREAKAYLSALADQARHLWTGGSPLAVTWSAVIDSAADVFEADVAGAILRTAEVGDDTEGAAPAGRCDLIALATRGLGGVQPWEMGSVAERLVQAASLATLLVHPHDGKLAYEEWSRRATTDSQQEQ